MFPMLSGYLELSPHVFSGGQDFKISMELRTDQLNALLLFTYHTQSEDYMLVRAETHLILMFLNLKHFILFLQYLV